MAGTLKLGSSYSSFSDLEAAIDAYERCKFVNYYKRSSRSIEAHKKRCPKIANAANPALVHAEITYYVYVSLEPTSRDTAHVSVATAFTQCMIHI